MKPEFYPSIYKRKSFHTFKNVEKEKISHQELETIYSIYSTFESLFDIQTKIRIVSGNQIEKSRDGQYCILFYSEIKQSSLVKLFRTKALSSLIKTKSSILTPVTSLIYMPGSIEKHIPFLILILLFLLTSYGSCTSKPIP